MIPEQELRLKIWKEKRDLRRDWIGNREYVDTGIAWLNRVERLLRECAIESKQRHVSWPKKLRWYMARDLYVAVCAAAGAFRQGNRKRGMLRLEKIIQDYSDVAQKIKESELLKISSQKLCASCALGTPESCTCQNKKESIHG